MIVCNCLVVLLLALKVLLCTYRHLSQTALVFVVTLSFNLFQGYHIRMMSESKALRIVINFQLNDQCVFSNICLQQSFFLGEQLLNESTRYDL